MNYCPKCEGAFFKNLHIAWCTAHQKEYDDYMNAPPYCACICPCGNDEWIDAEFQMTDPPSFPLMKIFRCTKCTDVKLEKSMKTDKIRIAIRE